MDLQDRQTRDDTGHFFSLTPEMVLKAIEELGNTTTGRCTALNSLENRVYDVELEDGRRIVGKFYRPGRWERSTIADEHRVLLALAEDEIPVCAPLADDAGTTLFQTESGIAFALFPHVRGRNPEDFTFQDYRMLGRLLGRIHRLASNLDLKHRPKLNAQTYGEASLRTILKLAPISDTIKVRYEAAAKTVIEAYGQMQDAAAASTVVHGDFHRGNILLSNIHHNPYGESVPEFTVLDFDDMVVGPAAQDFWLVLPGRRDACQQELDALIEGYQMHCDFDRQGLGLIEGLRALRYMRYAAWIMARWEDPAFPRAFAMWETANHWEVQITDLHEQASLMHGPHLATYA